MADRSTAVVRWLLRDSRYAWVVPLVVFEAVRREQGKLQVFIAAVVALGLVVAVVRRPGRALLTLLVVLPFQTIILAVLLKVGVPHAIVRPLGFWKEGLIAGLAAAAIVRIRRDHPSFDAADKLALAYVGLGTAYLFLPHLFVGSQIGAHLRFYVRELGWRSDVLYIGIFFVARHLALSAPQVLRLLRRVLAVGFVMALVGLFEFAASGTWNHLAVHVFGVQHYKEVVLHQTPGPSFNPTDVRQYANVGGHRFVRVGSVLFDHASAGFYFAFCLGVAAEMVARARGRTWVVVSIPLLGVALVLTQTRSALVAGVVALLFSVRAQIGRSIRNRARLALILGLVMVVAIPFALASGVLNRFSSSSGSNKDHSSSFHTGVATMSASPLGRGLSTAAGGGQLAANEGISSQSSVGVTESQWLQIGTQLGDLGLVLYAGAFLAMERRLRRRSLDAGDDPESRAAAMSAAGARNAFVGLVVGATFLQVFLGPELSWTVFALVGAAAGVRSRPNVIADDRQPTSRLVMNAGSHQLAFIDSRERRRAAEPPLR